MKATRPWHRTAPGRVLLFLGGVQLAIPVLLLVAVAMAWGTYLESTQSAKVARAAVYGSWWFIGLMLLVCMSLILAVLLRFPWKRKHIGFITVHSGLLLLIAGGFWSLFGRVEGTLRLREGMSAAEIELDHDVIELVRFEAGTPRTLARAVAPMGPGSLTLNDMPVSIIEWWPNVREEQYVANDGPTPYRAVEVALNGPATGTWIGDERRGGGPAVVQGLTVRVLSDGTDWEAPPPPREDDSGIAFVVNGDRYPLGAEGGEAFPGWTITGISHFQHALVSAGGITESTDDRDNPAIDVVITNNAGTVERHTVFLHFPDMVLTRRIEGEGASGARLVASSGRREPESLVVYGPVGDPRAAYVAPDGTVREFGGGGPFPWTLEAGGRRIAILQQFTHARNAVRFSQAPPASEQRPAVVLDVGDSSTPLIVAWKDFAPLPGGAGTDVIRYGPDTFPLPFTVRLEDFRKTDYPGTDMAMSYESDVTVSIAGADPEPFRVYMNNPFSFASWKVYQSGFIGDTISVFSVMKDPGLPLTYAGSIVLCVGLVLTFYLRPFSWGHPGIPIPFTRKETAHDDAASADTRRRPSAPVEHPEGVPAVVA